MRHPSGSIGGLTAEMRPSLCAAATRRVHGIGVPTSDLGWGARPTVAIKERNHGSCVPGDRSRSRLRTQHLALAPPDEAPLRPERAEEEVLRAVAQAQRHPHGVGEGHQGDRCPRHRGRRPGPPREGCEALMAKKAQDVRPIIKLRSTAGTGYTYVTRKN